MEKQYHVQRGPASRQAALRDARDGAAENRQLDDARRTIADRDREIVRLEAALKARRDGSDLRGPMRQRVVSDTMHHRLVRQAHASLPVWKSKFYGAFVLNRRVVLHAIDATPARWRGDAGSSLLDGTSAAITWRGAPRTCWC